ncbi:tol-pal system YbgF family protein [Caloramator sp. ALD01]|uniref:tetratricopeptide repeat protein n=1 Tax=Caloramator sp. ALD01 TaxID=1031288 RepID=UPI0003FEE127|nr:tetratricopeptide repeat protein [Caloramator sp. ALD01]
MLNKVQVLDVSAKRDGLYNFLKENNYISHIVIDDLIMLLDTIDEISKNKSIVKNEKLIIDLVAKHFKRSSAYIKLLLDFLKIQGILSDGEDFNLTSKELLIRNIDRYYLTAEIIRFLLLNVDWNTYLKSKDIYLSLESRMYIFALLSQTTKKLIEETDTLRENGIYKISYFGSINKLNSSLAFKRISEEVLERLNLGSVQNESFIPNDIGRRIFEYLAKDLLEQYDKLLDECWDYYDKGNFEQAFDIAKSIIKVLSFVPEAYNVLGCVYIKMGDIERARDMFNFAIDVYEKTSLGDFEVDSYISLYYNLGLSYYYMNEYFRALSIFKSLKKTIPYEIDNLDELIEGIKHMTIVGPIN